MEADPPQQTLAARGLGYRDQAGCGVSAAPKRFWWRY